MRNLFCLLSVCLFSIIALCESRSCPKKGNQNKMGNTQFISKEFGYVELDLYNYKKYPCTPGYPEDLFNSNIILINVPQKIIYKSYDKETIPIIPMCAIFAISQKHGLKYDHLSTKKIYIKRVDQDTIYSGEIIDPNLKYEHPIYPPGYMGDENKRLEMVNEAQKYSDHELDEGLIGGDAMNINLLEYVDLPFIAGQYEIFVSCYNLESNKVVVEIITIDQR